MTPGFSRAIPWKAKVPRLTGAFESQRKNQLGFPRTSRELERLRHHTDHRVRPRIDGHRAPDDGAVAQEPAPPIAMGEDDRLRRARRVVRLREPAAQQRLHVERIQDAMGHHQHSRQFGLPRTSDGCDAETPQSEVLKRPVLVAIREVHRRRTTHAGVTGRHPRRGVPDANQCLRVRIWERTDQHALDDAEDGGVAADAQRQRQHHGGRECRILSEAAKRVARVARKRFEQWQASLVPIALLDRFHAAELQQRLSPGFFGRQTTAHVLSGLHGDVIFDLRPQELFIPRRRRPRGQPPEEPPQHLHYRSCAFAAKKRPMIVVVCSQKRASACSCFLPCRVSR